MVLVSHPVAMVSSACQRSKRTPLLPGLQRNQGCVGQLDCLEWHLNYMLIAVIFDIFLHHLCITSVPVLSQLSIQLPSLGQPEQIHLQVQSAHA